MFSLCTLVTIPQALAGTKALVDKSVFSANGKRATAPLPQAAIEALGARVVEDYETMAVVDLGPATAPGLSRALGLSVSPLPNHDKILLRDYTIDSSGGLPPGLTSPAFPGNAKNLYLVTFRSTPKPEWLEALDAVDALRVNYIPENSYLVYARLDNLEALRAKQGPVVNVLPFVPAFRHLESKQSLNASSYSPVLVKILDIPTNNTTIEELRGAALPGTLSRVDFDRFTCIVAELPAATIEGLAYEPEVVSIEPAPKLEPSGERNARIVAGKIFQDQETGKFKPNCDTDSSYYTWLNQNELSDLSDTVLGILDTGLDIGSTTDVHKDFMDDATIPSSRVVYQVNEAGGTNGTTDCMGHGTLVAAMMAGSGGSVNGTQLKESAGCLSSDGFFLGTGIAPTARIASAKIYDESGLSSEWQQMFWRIRRSLLDFSYLDVSVANLSSNNTDISTYSTLAQFLDSAVRDVTTGLPSGLGISMPMVITVSAGNSGGFPVGDPAQAKNIITVGASEGVNPNSYGECGLSEDADNAYDIPWPSSHGCADGRVKPDLVAPGTRVTGAASRDPNFAAFTADQPTCWGHIHCWPALIATEGSYSATWSNGTSFAAPQVAGAAALVGKWYLRDHSSQPSPAMTKAMLINSALDIQGGEYASSVFGLPLDHIPSLYQGWGKLDLARAFPEQGTYFSLDQSVVLTTSGGSPWVGNFEVDHMGEPVRISLVWTDATGSPEAAHQLVNDLDLKVSLVDSNNNCWMAAGNTTISGADGLSGFVRCDLTLTPDVDNNVEQVLFMPTSPSMVFQVTVAPRSLNEKALPYGPGIVNQDFALFIKNASDI